MGVNTLASGGSVSLVARHISGDTVKAADNVSLKAGDDGIQLVFVDARGVMQAVANGGIRMEALGAGDGPAQVLLQSTRKGANVSIGQAVIRDSLTVAASSADINLKTPNPGYISVTLNGFDGEVPMETIYLSTSGTESLRFATYNVKNGHVRTDATDVAFDDAWADRLELWSAQAYTLLDSYETRRQDAGLQIHSTDGHYSFQLKGQILEAFDGLVVRRMDAVIPGSQPIEDGSALQQSRENNSLQKVSRFFITRNEEGLQGEIREVITENILKWENAHYELQGILDWAPVQRSLPEILYWVPEAKRFPELETNP